ncbi:UPF0481 protein At3g47200-like [Musa acuminata AAA Group]|uniref:UPF0481 protein At3g47200-like n=1 Tax=Musa acuminata AAA Group TaxID=214697 RepID=UPI0031E286CC
MSIAEEKIEIITNDEWLSSLKTRVAKTKWVVGRTSGPTIFKVPRIFQEADPKAYEPKMVSLGPYHHGNIHLKAMEDLKWHYLKEFLGRNPGKPLEDYIDQIKKREHEARMAYSEKVDMTSDEFAQMMLLDCCFVIEIIDLWKTYVERQEKEEEEEEEAVDKQIRCAWPWFRTARPIHSVAAQPRPLMHSVAMRPTLSVFERPMTMFGNQLRTDEKGTEAEHNPITSTRYTLPVVVRDMLMLENQLPFFLLETLFHSAFPKSPDRLENWIFKFVSNLVKSKIENSPNIGDVKVHHILHLLHYCIDPAKTRDGGKPSSSLWHKPNRKNLRRSREDNHPTPLLKWIPSATQLMEAGIHFRKKKEATNFLDITFQNGEMEIPLLQVDDGTNILFRNLLVFEQCSKNVSLHVPAYATLMDCIINTAADVALLQQHGIILSCLGDGKQVADLFNKLCKEVTLDYEKSYVSGIYKDVNKHWTNKYNQWRARLNHDYFSNPWAVISVFAAILLFGLAITQTIYSALSYVRPPN